MLLVPSEPQFLFQVVIEPKRGRKLNCISRLERKLFHEPWQRGQGERVQIDYVNQSADQSFSKCSRSSEERRGTDCTFRDVFERSQHELQQRPAGKPLRRRGCQP